MSADLTLDLAPLVIPEPAPTREQRWQAFAAANPHIERLLVASARELVNAGHRRLSMRMLWEHLRFRYATSVLRRDSIAALNNNHAPFYAKHLMATYPDLAGVFETRERAA